MAETADNVLIWSIEHSAYWAPDCAGYRTDARGAGRYDRQHAEDIVRDVSKDPRKACEIHEIRPGDDTAITGTVADLADEELLRRAILNARPRGRYRNQPRWACVVDAFGLGSTYSKQLCARFGIEAEKIVRR